MDLHPQVDSLFTENTTASGSRRRGVSSSLLGNSYLLPLSFYTVGYVRGTFVGRLHLTFRRGGSDLKVPKETPEP